MDVETALRNLLDRIAAERNYRQPQITIKPVISGGANYSSAIYLATIAAAGQPDIKAFAKAAAFSEEMRNNPTVDRLYSIEKFAFTELFTTFQSFQDKYDIPDNERLAFPIFYGCDQERLKEIVVMEDLMSKGFGNFDRFETVSWEYAAAAATALAKWHALSFVYQHEQPEEYEEKMTSIMYEANQNSDDSMWKNLMAGAIKLVQDQHKEKLTRFINEHATNAELCKYYLPRTGMTKVFGHGDYKPGNMMHKTQDGKLNIIPVDYQTICPNSPVTDLLYFIFSGSDSKFRRQHYTQLVDHYHQQLGLELQRFKLNVEQVYPRSQFNSELKELLPFGLVFALLILPMLLVEAADAPTFDKGVNNLDIPPNKLYAQRLNGIVDNYVEWGILC